MMFPFFISGLIIFFLLLYAIQQAFRAPRGTPRKLLLLGWLPALLVTLIFRTLDGFRVFDLIYVMTHGGPGTATEPVALYAFDALFDHLRFGYGSALSVIIFVATFLLALVYLKVLGAGLTGRPE